ncbi:MAG: FAD-binding oxidoreductase [Gammaproteobacteria bacterium]|nr:FAD-binding oxidoreductase [Gammaproteobacteria bacterium]
MTDRAGVVEALNALLGADKVRADADALQQYGLDWTRFYQPDPTAIVFPASAEDVQALVHFANERNIALVPSGGRTGLSGGAVAREGEVVVSFGKMNRILDYNSTEATVTVEPGVITQTLQEYAESQGLYYPVDFASAGSSHIGGNIATNAGGIKVLRYGMTREWIAGLKVVTGNGDLLEVNKGLVKNATGYDLRHLFIGSEGTLGFVVEATVRLTEPPVNLTVMLLAVPEMEHLIAVMETFRSHVPLTAYEFFSEKALQKVVAHGCGQHPFAEPCTYYALLEFEKTNDAVEAQALAAFEACLAEGLALDGVVSENGRQYKDLWRFREGISESITPYTPYKNDISVTVSKVPEFLHAVESSVVARYPEFEIIWFGHIGDGNLHLNILRPDSLDVDAFKRECEQVSEEVLSIVQDFGGSISAEHGVGLLKRDQLHFSRSPAEIATMVAMKRVFDPNGIMNPGKVLPAA